MNNREVSIAICGAVVGVILGTGSIAFTQDLALGADLGSGLHSDFSAARARNVSKQPIYRQDVAKDSGMQESSASSVASVPETPTCVAVRDAIADVQALEDRLLPDTPHNRRDRELFETTVAAALARHCPPAAPAAASADAASSDIAYPSAPGFRQDALPLRDNHCERWMVNGLESARSFRCRVNETLGKKYP